MLDESMQNVEEPSGHPDLFPVDRESSGARSESILGSSSFDVRVRALKLRCRLHRL